MDGLNSRREVVITGMGALSALGTDVDENWATVSAGIGRIKSATLDTGKSGPPPQTVPLALVEASPQELLGAEGGRKIGALDEVSIYALKVVREALGDAGLLSSTDVLAAAAVVFGQGNGGTHSLERAYERFYGMKSPRLHPLTVPRVMVSAAVSAITMEFGIKGPAFAVSSACASSGHGIVQGASLIMSGLVDIAIVGGSEAIASPATMRAWEAVQAISETTCRPFSIGRDGTVVGEGAAALVLEAADHAAARNARVLGRFCGAGMSSDAFHWTQPSPEGAVTAMGKALRHGDVPQGAAVLVAAHGTGTVLNDRNEARAIAQVLGSRKCPYQVIATKGAHGHLIGASLALQTVIGLKALQTGIAPPVLNYLGPDPEFDLDIVTTLARPIDANFLLANAFAFGGLNASLVFSL